VLKEANNVNNEDYAALERRVAALEGMLQNFAAMIVGTPGELERVASTIEVRKVAEVDLPISEEKHAKAIQKIGRLLIGAGQVSHSDVVRACQGFLTAREVRTIMSELASKGEVKITLLSPERGKPTTCYEHIARSKQIT